MIPRTKIVATIGPASDSEEVLEALIRAGVDVCRLGLAHGTIPEHRARIARIRAVSERIGQPVAILGDLPGPKIRMGAVLDDAGMFLTEGHRFEVWPGLDPTTDDRIHVDYEHLVEDVDVGDSLVLGDGSVRLITVDKTETHLVVEVEHGGRIQGRPGVTLPSGRLRVSVPTDVDIELIDALADDLDFIAASFVRSAAEVEAVKARAGTASVVAKIETKAAVEALDEIVNMSDAVMVARGDLGNECDIAEVPHLQKQIIRRGVAFGVPVITATQMLESMIHSPSPTRAEATDVANAVFDGTTAVMLSAETAIGHNPVLVIKTMAHLCERAEAAADYETWGASLGRIQGQVQLDVGTRITAGMSHAAWRLATELELDAIISCTNSGYTARAMSRFRPPGVLIGASPIPHTVRQLAMVWGTQPMLVDQYKTTDEMVDHAVHRAKQLGYVKIGQVVAVLAGAPDGLNPGTTDVLRVVPVT
ncbi:pyruvate kinase [Actinospongicola halichondriae]|uniref:pyruvate kinase n=1 Tax=Actinospongicola halichondriae TaxID=3236844 RepID=UPI003D4B318F